MFSGIAVLAGDSYAGKHTLSVVSSQTLVTNLQYIIASAMQTALMVKATTR